MNHRLSTIFARKSYTGDATELIDLNVADPISQLLIKFDKYNVSKESQLAHPLACLTKIELVDGSDVLFSLEGREAAGVDWYHNKIMRMNRNMLLETNFWEGYVGMNFGRKLWDTELAFVPKNFRNPQLKITLDLDAAMTGDTPDRITVLGALFDEKAISPVGFLMHKVIKNYSQGASSHEYTDLPTDYPIRKLFIRCQVHGAEPNTLISNIKLSEDNDKKVVFDDGIENIINALREDSPMIVEEWWTNILNVQRYMMVTPTQWDIATGTQWREAPVAVVAGFYDGDGGRLKTIAASGGELNWQLRVSGWLPHGMIEIPFGDQMEIDDWYDVTKLGSLRADILSSSSGLSQASTVQVILQQLRSY